MHYVFDQNLLSFVKNDQWSIKYERDFKFKKSQTFNFLHNLYPFPHELGIKINYYKLSENS